MPNVAVGPRGKAQKISLKPLKQYAAKLRPSLLKEILLDEPEPEDELDFREFLGRVHVWLRLLCRPEFLEHVTKQDLKEARLQAFRAQLKNRNSSGAVEDEHEN